ncbi:hypothetical protein LCGC14_2302350, partial [marine sediment metagenome]
IEYISGQFATNDLVLLEALPQRGVISRAAAYDCYLVGTRYQAQQSGVHVPPSVKPAPPISQTQPIPPNFGPGDWVLYKGNGPFKIEDMWPDTTGYMCLLGDPKRPNAKRRGYAHDCKQTSPPPQPIKSRPGPRQQSHDLMKQFSQMNQSQQDQITDMLRSLNMPSLGGIDPSSSKPPDALGSISTPPGTKSFYSGDTVQYGKERVTFVDFIDSDKDIARIMDSKGAIRNIGISFLTPL